MTSVNVQTKDLQGESRISQEHIANNAAVRDMLVQRGIVPENLPPAEDVKKVERRLASEQKKALENKKKNKMEQNKKELLLGQIYKINEVIFTLSENFSQEDITNH